MDLVDNGSNSTCEVFVVGSASIDLVTYSTSLPLPGETVFGTAFEKHYGGKGANQAVQCAELGVRVGMCGRVGSDSWGPEYIENMKSHGINTSAFLGIEGNTGIASIFVSSSGSNCIVIVPGTNGQVTPDSVCAGEEHIRASLVVVCQNEIPFESTRQALLLARNHQTLSIFNPAPAANNLSPLINLCDIVCPNETELATLTGRPTNTLVEIENAAAELLEQCPDCKVVLVTLGERGAMIVSRKESVHVPTEKVTAVDTVGAGDSFIGSLAANLARLVPVRHAVERALGCATLSVQLRGAQESYRNIKDIPSHLHPPSTLPETITTLSEAKAKLVTLLDN